MVAGAFTDASPVDTHTVMITWGDGATSAATVNVANVAPVLGALTLSHGADDPNQVVLLTGSFTDVGSIGGRCRSRLDGRRPALSDRPS